MSTQVERDHAPRQHRLAPVYRTGSLSNVAELGQAAWDGLLAEHGGHLMQSWRWGEFMKRAGWSVERLHLAGPSGVAMAQVQFKHWGPVTTAIIQRGPLLVGDQTVLIDELRPHLDATCRRHRAVLLAVEAAASSPLTEMPQRFGFEPTATRYTPGRTVVVPLLEDQPLLEQMNSGTRHKVRRAGRHGVEIRRVAPDETTILAFHTLLQETASRQGFPINPPGHYLAALRLFGEDAAFFMAAVEGADVAGVIAARFGDEAIYLFGASATEQPVRGATALLHYEVMRWARGRGARRYDLWGIDRGRTTGNYDPFARSTTHDCVEDDGLCRFKVGFGGDVVVLPGRIERHYHPLLNNLLNQAKDLRRAPALQHAALRPVRRLLR